MATFKKFFVGLMLLLSACSISNQPPMARPQLPGKLIIYDEEAKAFLQYTSQGEAPFIATKGYSLDELGWDTYKPATSPDEKWSVAFDKEVQHFVVTGPSARYVIEEYVISWFDMAWSRDNQYLAYIANDQDGEWISRVMVLSLADGTKTWIGTGIYPRWYP